MNLLLVHGKPSTAQPCCTVGAAACRTHGNGSNIWQWSTPQTVHLFIVWNGFSASERHTDNLVLDAGQ
jgi:hypothetical protein